MKSEPIPDFELTITTRKGFELQEISYNMNVLDVLAAQQPAQILSHTDIINRYKIKLFVELGTYMGGGLVHVIPNLILDQNFSYIGYEILPEKVNNKILAFASEHPRCEIVLQDMFIAYNLGVVSEAIASTRGCVYVFCDGGNKPKELETFSKFLRIGDIISVHDYVEDQTGEVTDQDLEKLGDDFEPLDEELRKNILWMPTFIKVL
ncbi:MAG: hypothetical protein KAR20_25615 [Candidatus Heimdallarchaeota archaeon]|nr:hypothetical protein [Candidatus Heimdallarchaeota archaeon]